MSLDTYLGKGSGYYWEIADTFDLEEVAQLGATLKALGPRKYSLVVLDHLALIEKYSAQTPSQRKQKRWKTHEHALAIRYAALQLSFATWGYQERLRGFVPGGSYRSFFSDNTKYVLEMSLRPFWRFHPIPGLEDPFS